MASAENGSASTGIPNAETVFPPANANGSTQPQAAPAFNDWSKSFHGLSTQPFSSEIAEILQAPIDPMDIEMKPGELVVLVPKASLTMFSPQMVSFTFPRSNTAES